MRVVFLICIICGVSSSAHGLQSGGEAVFHEIPGSGRSFIRINFAKPVETVPGRDVAFPINRQDHRGKQALPVSEQSEEFQQQESFKTSANPASSDLLRGQHARAGPKLGNQLPTFPNFEPHFRSSHGGGHVSSSDLPGDLLQNPTNQAVASSPRYPESNVPKGENPIPTHTIDNKVRRKKSHFSSHQPTLYRQRVQFFPRPEGKHELRTAPSKGKIVVKPVRVMKLGTTKLEPKGRTGRQGRLISFERKLLTQGRFDINPPSQTDERSEEGEEPEIVHSQRPNPNQSTSVKHSGDDLAVPTPVPEVGQGNGDLDPRGKDDSTSAAMSGNQIPRQERTKIEEGKPTDKQNGESTNRSPSEGNLTDDTKREGQEGKVQTTDGGLVKEVKSPSQSRDDSPESRQPAPTLRKNSVEVKREPALKDDGDLRDQATMTITDVTEERKGSGMADDLATMLRTMIERAQDKGRKEAVRQGKLSLQTDVVEADNEAMREEIFVVIIEQPPGAQNNPEESAAEPRGDEETLINADVSVDPILRYLHRY